jgi:hypothetical protein
MQLIEAMGEAVNATKDLLSDDGKLSAIGMARSWVTNRKPVAVAVNSMDLKPRRDQLAVDLVGIMEANPATNEEYIDALLEVRKAVNAPYQNPGMLGFQAGRRELLKPRDVKKSKEVAK